MNTTLFESAALLGPRVALFLACRKYLLRSLYSDLQSLSSDTPSELLRTQAPAVEAGIELSPLPTPASAQGRAHRPAPDRTFVHSMISRTLFSLSFAESGMMFILLMLQGADVFSASTRLYNWRFSLAFLMATILFFVPLSLSLIVAIGAKSDQTTQRRLIRTRITLSFISVGLYLFAISRIPLPVALSVNDAMSSALSRLVVLGTLILGTLSGFGAVNNSWTFIPMLARSRGEPTDQDVSTAEYALQSVRNDISERTMEADRRAGAQTEESWFSRVVPNFRGDDGHLRELQGLQALEYQMSRNLDDLRQRREKARFSKTLKGRLFNFGGRIFALYCTVRIVSSIVNVAMPARRSTPKTTYPDLITDLLAQALSFTSPVKVNPEDVASFSRQLSLVLVGIIILTNIRLVLKGATRALRITSRNLGASLMMLLLAQLMGIYLLSTIVQMRASFPPPAVKPDEDPIATNLFSTIPEFEVFGSLFDWSFLAAAGVSAFWRWGAERVNGVGDV